ncbi:MAG TPA: exodeoxyribonuclease VII small subunit [Pirellulales bacterium]
MAEQNQKSSTAEPVSFEQALTVLEQIVHDLEEGRLGLAESLARYEEGVKLLRQCHGLLEQAERRIELVTGMDASGKPVTEPFDDEATFIEPEAKLPRARRGKASKKTLSQQIDESESSGESADSAMDEPGSLF